MKSLTAFAGTLIFAAAANAGYTGLSVEDYVGDGWVGGGYAGLTTYRVFANFDSEDDAVIAVNGSPLGAMEFHSTDGAFYNAAILDSLSAPQDATPAIWLNQWDTYVTVDTDTATGDATALSPGFDGEVGGLTGDFSTVNAAYYITPADFPQGLADGYKVMIAQLTVAEGENVFGYVNLQFGDASSAYEQYFPTPGALALLGLAGLVGRRRR